jgi:hypothetical protein
MSTRSYAQFHVNEVDRAARAAHARLMRGDFVTLYVYYRPLQIEAFADGEVPDLGWTRAWPDPVPGDRTADQLVQWFAARADSVPYLTE